MSGLLPGLVIAAVGLAMLLLGRWGRQHAESLVPDVVPEPRRSKELRTIRRGVKSCIVVGAFLSLNGVVFAVVAANSSGR